MNRVWTLIKKDLLSARRDSLVSYFVLSPFLLALLARLAIPLLEGVPLSFAVGPGVPDAVVASFERHGEVERFQERDALVERVSARDHIPGVVSVEGGRTELVLEGNEPAYVRMVPAMLIDLEAHRAAGGALPVLVEESLGEERPLMAAIGAALLGFAVLVVTGLVVGFAILEEKETNAARLLAVAPLSFTEYALAKVGLAVVLGVPLATAAMTIVVGPSGMPLVPVLLALLASLPIALSLGLIVGAFAKDQLGAIALLKGLFFFWLSVPSVAFAVEGTWRMAFAPFPNHHAVQALFGALTGQDYGTAAALSFGLGSAVLVFVLVVLRRRLGLGSFGSNPAAAAAASV